MPKGPSNTHSNGQKVLKGIHVSVDTVDYVIDDLQLNLPTNHSNVVNASKERIRQVSSKYSVPGVSGRATIQSTKLTLSQEANTRFSVSPAKFLSGQNICSPGNVKLCVGEAHARILRKVKQYSERPAECNSVHLNAGAINLRRVDLFACFALRDAGQVKTLIAYLRELLAAERKGGIHTYGLRYLRYGAKTRTGYHIVFYDKSLEVRQTLGEEYADRLGVRDGLLKVELRLERDELSRLGLAKLSAWDESTARRVFRKYVGEVIRKASMVVPVAPVSAKALDKLPAPLRPAYTILALGGDIGRVYSERTVRRYRAAFSAAGIAVAARSGTVPVAKILSTERALTLDMLPKGFRKGFQPVALRADKEKYN